MPLNYSGISRGSIVGRVARGLLSVVPKDAVVAVRQGELKGCKWVVGSSIHGCWLGTFEFPKQRLYREHLRPGMVVYDIGANVGFYTLLSSRLVGEGGRVFAFEPLPRNVAFLNRHVELNSAGGGGGGGCAANVTVIDAAVSDREGTAVFVPDGGGAPDRAHIVGTGDKNVDVRAEVEAGKGEAGLTVRTVSVDGLVAGKVSVRGKAQPLPPPDMMKIDVEGAEAMVLKGAARTILARMPIIFLATHGPQVHAVCCDMLRGWGYELRAVGGGHLDEAEEVVAVKR